MKYGKWAFQSTYYIIQAHIPSGQNEHLYVFSPVCVAMWSYMKEIDFFNAISFFALEVHQSSKNSAYLQSNGCFKAFRAQMALITVSNMYASHVTYLKKRKPWFVSLRNSIWNEIPRISPIHEWKKITKADSFGAILSHCVHLTGVPRWMVSMCFLSRYLFINDALQILQCERVPGFLNQMKQFWNQLQNWNFRICWYVQFDCQIRLQTDERFECDW